MKILKVFLGTLLAVWVCNVDSAQAGTQYVFKSRWEWIDPVTGEKDNSQMGGFILTKIERDITGGVTSRCQQWYQYVPFGMGFMPFDGAALFPLEPNFDSPSPIKLNLRSGINLHYTGTMRELSQMTEA